MKQYDSYKDSGVQWIGRIPSHWKVCRLKSILTGMQDGTHGTFQRISSPYLLLSAKNIFEDGIHISGNESSISENDYYSIISNGYPKFGDIAICCVGTIGRCCIYNETEPIAFQRSVTFLRIKKNIDKTYVLYCLRNETSKSYLNLYAKTSAQSGIYMGDLASLNFIFPPLSEQQAIATYLDKKCAEIDKTIATQQKRIELLQELRQNIITHAVTRGINPDVPLKDSGVEWIGMVPEHWEVMMLKRCATIKTGCTPPTKEEKYYEADDIDWFTPGDIGDDHIEEAEKKISDSAKRDGVCRIFPAKSVYFVGIGATIGKVSYCNIEASANQQINAIIPNKRATYKYITYCLKSQKEEVFLTANTVTLPIINQDRTGSLRIPVPPLKEQQAIVAYVEAEATKLDKLVAKANRQITLLQELKQSIITEVVTGKRKVC